jgi:hypothetical protein
MKMQTSLVIGKENQKPANLKSPIFQEKNNEHNKNWMKDWMEEADNYKNNPEAMTLIANNVDGFLHYADIVEGKYI